MHARTHYFYAAFYSSQFILLGIQLPFFSGWLAEKGISASDIGLLTGAALVARLVFGPFVAYWSDHQPDERLSLRIMTFVFAASAAALLLPLGRPFLVAAAIGVMWSYGLLVPLTDTAVLAADRAGRANFGQARAIGSFAFLATTILGGQVLTRFGLNASVSIMASSAAIAFFFSLVLPRLPARHSAAHGLSRREAVRLLASPVFLASLAASGLTQGAHAFYYAFSILDWTQVGYSPALIGILWATGVIAEIFVLTRMRGIAGRLRPDILMAIGAGGAALRWTVMAFGPPLPLLFLVQTLHACSFAAAYMGAVEFIDRAVPRRLVTTAMTLNSTAGVGAITGLAMVAAGYLYEASGAFGGYLLMAGMAALGCLIAVALTRRWDGKVLFGTDG